jgi:GAF domain-containing protein
VLEEEATLVIPDTSRDPRVCELATLRGQNIAFYAGTPLEDANGHVLGCLAILDDCPRQLAGAEIRLLERLARELMQGIQAATVRA